MTERYVLSQERLGLEAPQQEWIDCNRVWLTNSSGIAIGCVLYSSIATSIMRDVVCVIYFVVQEVEDVGMRILTKSKHYLLDEGWLRPLCSY